MNLVVYYREGIKTHKLWRPLIDICPVEFHRIVLISVLPLLKSPSTSLQSCRISSDRTLKRDVLVVNEVCRMKRKFGTITVSSFINIFIYFWIFWIKRQFVELCIILESNIFLLLYEL